MQEVGDTLLEWILLKKVYINKIKSAKSLSQLADIINVSRYSPLYKKIVNIMFEKGIMETLEVIGRSKIIQISLRKLEDYLRTRKPFLEVEEFIHKSNLFAVT